MEGNDTDELRFHQKNEASLETSNEKYFAFFNHAPMSLWIEDFSKVKQHASKLAKEHNTTIKSFIQNNPDIVSELALLVTIKEVNDTTLKLYNAKSKEELLGNLNKIFNEKSKEGFLRLIEAILIGNKKIEVETVNKTLDGKEFDALIKFQIIAGNEETLENVIVSVEDITERKKIKDLYLTNNQRLHNQFNNTPLASIIFDLDFKILEWNKSAERIFGYTAEEVKGKVSKDLLTPPHLLSKMKILRKTMFTQNESLKNTNENITKNGDIITCEWHTVVLRDSQNNITGRACLVDDKTESINSKKLLEKSEKKYKDIFDKTVDAVMVIKDGLFIECNESVLKMFGYDDKKSFFKIHPSKISPETQFDGSNSFTKAEEMMKIALEEGSNRFRWDHKKKNGDIFPVEVSLSKIDDDDNTPIIHTIIKDITERVKNEALEDVLYNISKTALIINDFKKFSLFIRNELHKIIDTSNFFIGMYNEENGMITTPVFVDDMEEIEDFPAEKSLTGHVIKTKKSLILNKTEYNNLIEEGIVDLIGLAAEKWIGVPLLIKNKCIGAIVVQSYDNEYAYNENDVQLLEFVADQISTTILRKNAEDDLKNALAKAKESDRLKSSFLANMSHEIRTPMNGIIGFSEFFLEPNLTYGNRNKYAKIIINSSKQLLSIVNDILDISKIEAGEITLNYERVSINKLLDDLFTFYQHKAQENNLILNCLKGLGSDASIIEIDKLKLYQVLNNLMSNAFKFTDEGSIEFGYTLEENKLLFYVKDTGAGIEEKLQNQIFDRFTQANVDLVKKNKGTGLGLAISKNFIELFNGEIWLKSNNKGSTIYFTIPYIKSKKQIITSVIEDQKPESQVKNKELTILVAEDEIYNMMYINELFSKSNFKIIEAENGKQALELSLSNPEIDLILMDIKMPIMDGNEAMKEIKKEKPLLPIIALSAFAMESDKKAAINDGFDAYLTKPIDKKMLFSLIDKYAKKL